MPPTHGILKASEEQKMAASQKQQQQNHMATNTTKLRGYLQVKHNPATRRSRLPRKAWRRQWVVLDIVETLSCPAVIGRIYNSHMHEDKTLPTSTVTLTDVHGLHRAQSRSHPYAFSLDGSCQCLILSGNCETESQLWMRQIRDVLWPRAPNSVLWMRTECYYEVSLIDNVHSDIARLRGFYGQLVVDGRDVLLVEARTGNHTIRWPIKSLKKWFCPKVAAREDRDKIIVIITHKNCSSGEGIFTFYCRKARELVALLTATSKNQPLSSMENKKSHCKMNPLLALLRRGNNQRTSTSNKKISKSASSADHLDKTGGFEGPSAAPPIAALSKSLRRGFSLDRHLETSEKKKSASESNLLGVASNQDLAENKGFLGSENPDFPAPPNEEELQKMSVSATLETVTGAGSGEGFYRSFDDLDDIDDHLMSVLADSNPIEAAVVLRGENLSQNGNGRNSFNSSDSGRMSDTYAETSNSSVASSTNGGHNRLHSNMSNCSGDSGAQLSLNSNDSSNKVLEVLKEQESPDFAPFDQEIYGHSVSIKNNVYQTPAEAKNEVQQQSEQQQQQPRFATVRKSYTLPHGMNNASGSNSVASTPTVLSPRKRKDLSLFLGLHDEGPGSPSKEVAQAVAMQNLPQENCNEKIEKYLGINQQSSQQAESLQTKRPRPKSLGLERSSSIEQRPKRVQSPVAPLSKTLARLQRIKESADFISVAAKSLPATPATEVAPLQAEVKQPKKPIIKTENYKLQAQSNLSKSMDLDSNEVETPSSIKDRSWQSNEGLTNSGSGGLPTPMEPMSPAIKKIMPSNGLILRVSHGGQPRSASDERKNCSSASNSPYHASLGRGATRSVAYNSSSLQRGGMGVITKNRYPNKRMMPRSATLDDLEPPHSPYYEPVMWVQRGGSCHPCCCTYRHHHPAHTPNGSLPRYPNHYDFLPARQPSPAFRDYRSSSVAFEGPKVSTEPVYLSMTRTKRVVVIPINGGVSAENVVQIRQPLRESSVDYPEYMTLEGSKVVSMGNKTCISVNESSLVSTKAIVHQQP